jgi:hypothetical protein
VLSSATLAMVLDWVPTVHRLTFLSSPPVTSTPDDFLPILTQFTLPVWAANSSARHGQGFNRVGTSIPTFPSCGRCFSPWLTKLDVSGHPEEAPGLQDAEKLIS